MMAAESIPPPYIMKPLSEFLNVDEGDVIEKNELSVKQAFKKRNNHHHHDVNETVENDNPFSTSTINSLIHLNSFRGGKEEEIPSDSDIRYPSLCVVPFFELARVIRSKTAHKLYKVFQKANPDFFNWGDISSVLGDDFLSDIPDDWFSKWLSKGRLIDRFCERSYLMYQYLSLFIEMCEDFVYITGMKRSIAVALRCRRVLGGNSGIYHVSPSVFNPLPILDHSEVFAVHPAAQRRSRYCVRMLHEQLRVGAGGLAQAKAGLSAEWSSCE